MNEHIQALKRENSEQIERMSEEMEQRVTLIQEESASKAKVMELDGCIANIGAIAKAGHGKLANQVVTKGEIEDQLRGLEQKQKANKTSLEKLCSVVHTHTTPVMTNFEQHKKDDDEWYSEGFSRLQDVPECEC